MRSWLRAYKDGKFAEDEFVRRLKNLPYQDLDYAKVDHHRTLRRGFPEVIYGESKEIEQILAIADKLKEQGTVVLITRLDGTKIERLQKQYPKASVNRAARTVTLFPTAEAVVNTAVRGLVITAGTADIPVAEEAAATIEAFAYPCDRLYDVGVAGLHRLVAHRERIERADAIVVAAGMEGALPSVVAGLADVPIIAVPTSVGYGAAFGGIAALLSMLTGCAGGVAVVNIDSGFAAGFMLATILRNLEKKLDRAGV